MATRSTNCTIPDCARCAQRGDSLFATLDDGELSTVSAGKVCRQFQRGDVMFRPDERAGGLFCIHSGVVKVYRLGTDGREQILKLAHPGETLGYRALVGGVGFDSFGEAIAPTNICFIPESVIFAGLASSHNLTHRLLQLLSAELGSAEDQIVRLAQKPVRERLAETLLLLEKTYGTRTDGRTIDIRLTRNELASMVGSVPESTIRALSKLKDEGMLDLVGHSIQILNHASLVHAANLSD